MIQHLKISYFKPEKQGVFPYAKGCRFARELLNGNSSECGIILYDKQNTEYKIPFSPDGKRGTLYGIQIEGENLNGYKYLYYEKDEIFTDSYAQGISGLEIWGKEQEVPRTAYGRIVLDEFDWEEDKSPCIPYKDSVIYGLNVRAFTMHKSSGVKNKGTFEGMVEKLPHLLELGITAVELMPAYEYEECMLPNEKAKTIEEASQNYNLQKNSKVNCWGFQKGFYFSPKASYAADLPEKSFKKMVKAFHEKKIEVYMHFYFPPGLEQAYILEILKYWVMEYHIDGVRLSGFDIPFKLIAQEPMLKETKIRSDYFPIEEIYGNQIPLHRNLAAKNGGFREEMRRFLKGDESLINQVAFYHRNNPVQYAVINYLSDYDGFSLWDSVSYERKHNEANGEENRDGTDYNFSWNCGIEGESRKKSIIDLRIKQIKNALSFLFLAQGVPFLFAGDEFGNTRIGNNNAYCQDNEIGWIKWKDNQISKELFGFTKQLIEIRKAHPVLHMEKELQIMDSKGCGYPDISYHGMEAWRPDMSYISRMIGIMLCGKYVTDKEDNSLYIAYNMHWQEHKLALPILPKGMKWTQIMETDKPIEEYIDELDENRISIKGRSVLLYCAVEDASYLDKEKNKKNSRKAGKKNERVETF